MSQPGLFGLMSDVPYGHKTHFLFNQYVAILRLQDWIKCILLVFNQCSDVCAVIPKLQNNSLSLLVN